MNLMSSSLKASSLMRSSLLSAIALMGAMSASADDVNERTTTVTDFIQSRGYSIVKTFNTDATALTGYVLKSADGKYAVIYSLDDLIISGQIVDKNGSNLGEKYAQQNVPKPDFAKAVKSLESDKSLVIEGKKTAPVIYVFADPNCIFCHKFYESTRDWVTQGKVQLRWIMVGFLKPSSPGRAAAVMAAKDRAAAHAQNHANFDEQTEEASLAELQPIPKDLQETLHNHELLMNDMQFQGTPGLIFKDKDSKWQGIAGMPAMPQLAALIGISEK